MQNEPGTINACAHRRTSMNIAIAVRKELRIAGARQGGRARAAAASSSETGARRVSSTSRRDPEAARIVFNEFWPLMMVGLDVTHEALATPDVIAAIEAVGTWPALGSWERAHGVLRPRLQGCAGI